MSDSRTVLSGAALLDPEAPEPRSGHLLLEDGRIVACLPLEEEPPADARRLRYPDCRIAPGLIDLHYHGDLIFAGPEALPRALDDASRRLLRHGVTAFLPTTVARPHDALVTRIEALCAALDRTTDAGAAAVGLHLEGPWINPEAAGAQPDDGIRPPEPAEIESILAAGSGRVRMVTLAPELPGAVRLVERLVRASVVAAAGHTLARDADLDASCDAGMTHVTHLFNAMGPVRHREPGVPGYALSEDRLTCDLICDGVHVHPRMVRIAARALGDRLVLITDRIELPGAAPADAAPAGAGAAQAAAALGFGSGQVVDDGEALRLPDGRLAGSRLTLDRALAKARRFAGLSDLEAVAAASFRPARVLGLEAERGSLRPGARADLVILDAEGEVVETWIAGEPRWRREPVQAPGPTRPSGPSA